MEKNIKQLNQAQKNIKHVLLLLQLVQNIKMGVPGEKELGGRGVSYCAVCDGAFFKQKSCCRRWRRFSC